MTDTGMVEHVVVAAILRQGERLLLCHRSPTRRWYPDVWDFPGGHVEVGELPRDALRRELREEIGVDIDAVGGRPILRKTDPGGGLDLTVWLISSWRGSVENRQPEEHDAIAWFGNHQLVGLNLADSSYLPVLCQVLGDGGS